MQYYTFELDEESKDLLDDHRHPIWKRTLQRVAYGTQMFSGFRPRNHGEFIP